MGDFNINLLDVETCNYAHNFLLSSQSFSLIPTIDKPTRVYHSQKFRTMSGVTYVATFNAVTGSRFFRKQVTLVPLTTSKL